MKNRDNEHPTATEILPPSAILAREIEEPPPSGPPCELSDGAVFPSCPELLDTYEQVASCQVEEVAHADAESLKMRGIRKKKTQSLAFRIGKFHTGRAERMHACSSHLTRRTCAACGKERFHADRCGDRLCPTCARIRSAKMVDKYAPALAEYGIGKHAYLLTLTYTNSEHLPDRKRLAADFRALKRNVFWRQFGGIAGGAYSIEVTFNEKTRQFHPHLHVLLYTMEPIPTFVDKKGNERWQIEGVNQAVSDLWREITGGSYIVDGRAFDGRCEELMKYVTTIEEVDRMPDRQLEELCAWMKGMRTFTTFGGLYGMKFPESDPEPKHDAACECGCTVHEELRLEYNARLGVYVPVSCATVDCSSAAVESDTGPP